MTPAELITTITSIQNPHNFFVNQDLIGFYSSRIENLAQIHNPEAINQCLASLQIAFSGICYDMIPSLFGELYNAAAGSVGQ